MPKRAALKILQIDFTQYLSGRRILTFPHCELIPFHLIVFRLHTHHDNNNSPNKTNLSPSKNNKKRTTPTTTQPWLSPGHNRKQRSKSLDTNSLSLNDSSNEDTDKSDAKKSEKECR